MEKNLTGKEALVLVLSFEDEMNSLICIERGFSKLGHSWRAGE